MTVFNHPFKRLYFTVYSSLLPDPAWSPSWGLRGSRLLFSTSPLGPAKGEDGESPVGLQVNRKGKMKEIKVMKVSTGDVLFLYSYLEP